MKNLLFYLATVFIWGSTWIAIKFQLGVVAPIVSVGYRFALASILLMLWCYYKRLPMRFTIRDHCFIVLQGTLLFAINYQFFYLAELYITSGLAAVIFSTILLMNMLNGTLFLRSPIDLRVVAGGVLGLGGIILVFSNEITGFTLDDESFRGVLFCTLATYLASLGNILSARNQKNKLPVVQTNAYGMGYGALLMLSYAFISGQTFLIETTALYVGSLIYLSVFGSIIAFGCYLSLIGSIGADRAAYATLLFPLVALGISTLLEDYHWSVSAVSGVAMILLGNLLMLQRKKRTVRKIDEQQPPQEKTITHAVNSNPVSS